MKILSIHKLIKNFNLFNFNFNNNNHPPPPAHNHHHLNSMLLMLLIFVLLIVTNVFVLVQATRPQYEQKSYDTVANGVKCRGSTQLEHFTGVCMFHYECLQKQGVSIGPCFANNLVGSCCMIQSTLYPTTEVKQSKHIANSAEGNKLNYALGLNSDKPHKTANQNSTMVSWNGDSVDHYKTSTSPQPPPPRPQQPSSLINEVQFYEIISANNRRTTTTTSKPELPTGGSDEHNSIPIKQMIPATDQSDIGAKSNGSENLLTHSSKPPSSFASSSSTHHLSMGNLSPFSAISAPLSQLSAAAAASSNEAHIPLGNPNIIEDVFSNHFPLFQLVLPTAITHHSTDAQSNTDRTDNESGSSQSSSVDPSTRTTSTTSTTTTTTTTTSPFDRMACGIRPLRPTGRVVGGRNAQFGEWPWQVLIKESTWLGFFLKAKCGGVLIDYKWVLTAAHCQPGMMGSLVVMLGQHELHGDGQQLKPLVKTVKRMIVHRDYNPETFDNDIALLELDTPFEMQPHIVPICLPEQEEDYVGKFAYVAGWGKLSYGGLIPSILQTVKLPIIANHVCQKMFADAGHYKYIRESFLCAGYPQGGKDTCEGDSGGPLMVQKRGVWSLLGTVSHGIKCAEPNMPGVYMKTHSYLNWIKGIIERH